MEKSPDTNDNYINSSALPNDKLLEFLKQILGEEGVIFLNLNNAITALKQSQPVWQVPFAIGLWGLPFLYYRKTDNLNKLEFFYRFPEKTNGQNKQLLMTSTLMVFGLSSQIRQNDKNEAFSNIEVALEAIESRYDSLSSEIENGFIR
jgi:hypothetical protein